jgi:hypothetical protein
MKHTILVTAILFSMAGSASAFAEEQAAPADPAETVASDTQASTTEIPGTPRMLPGKGMMHGGGQHGKGQGNMRQCGGRHGKGGHDDDRQALQRLDMIEARMAKIETMLEILVRR